MSGVGVFDDFEGVFGDGGQEIREVFLMILGVRRRFLMILEVGEVVG